MEQELRRASFFPERKSLEVYLIPRWIETGRLDVGAACLGLDSMLRRMGNPVHPSTYTGAGEVHELRFLIAARPHAAEQSIARLLDSGARMSAGSAKLLREELAGLRGEAPPVEDDSSGDNDWTPEEQEEFLTEGDLDARGLKLLPEAHPDLFPRVEAMDKRILADAGGDPRTRAEELVELGIFYLRRGDRERALGLTNEALRIQPIDDAWRLLRKLDLGRPADR